VVTNEFWLERWQSGRIGFHRDEVNPWLVQYWPQVARGASVLVPLCGKSLDMLWLRQQGHEILGIELSPVAAKEFFEENNIEYAASKCGEFQNYASEGYSIMVGDIFNLTKSETANINAVYDRAALIALPPPMQKTYVAHLRNILPPDTQILLITLEYDPSELDGPPFSIPEPYVQALFGHWCHITLLQATALTDFRDIAANETAYKLIVK